MGKRRPVGNIEEKKRETETETKQEELETDRDRDKDRDRHPWKHQAHSLLRRQDMLQRRKELKNQLRLARQHHKGGKGQHRKGGKGGGWTDHGQRSIQQLEEDIAATQHGKEYEHRGDISSRVCSSMKSSRK